MTLIKNKVCFVFVILIFSIFLANGQNWEESIVSKFETGCPKYLQSVDIDADGDMDIVHSSNCAGVGHVVFNENLNNGYFSAKQLIDESTGVDLVRMGDLNGDGLPDAVIGSNRLWYRINLGSGEFGPKQDVFDNSTVYPAEIEILDFDNDGLNDIVVFSGTYDRIDWYKNLNGSFGARQMIADQVDYQVGYSAVDFNNNGLYDIVYAIQGTQELLLITNNGNGSFTSSSLYTIPDANPNQIDFYFEDLSNDGLPDLLISIEGSTANNKRIIRLMNTTGNSLGSPVIINNSMSFTAIRSFDVNNDGQMDIVAHDDYNLYVLLRNGITSFASPIPLGIPISSTANYYEFNLCFEDFNSDGIMDLAVSKWDQNRRIPIFLGSGNNSYDFQQNLGLFTDGTALDIGDFLNNGENQILSYGDIHSSTSNNLNLYSDEEDVSDFYAPYNSKYVDLNMDGIRDLIFVYNNEVYIKAGLSSGNFDATVSASLYVQNGLLDLLDITGDGHLDIVIFKKPFSSSQSTLYYYINDGNNNFSSSYISMNLGNSSEYRHHEIFDVNSDGLLDIVNVHNSNSFEVKYNQGNNTFSSDTVIIGSDIDPGEFNFYDFDNDGFDDIIMKVAVATWNHNAFMVIKNNGSTGFTVLDSLPLPYYTSVNQIKFSDIDGNGFQDLVYNLESSSLGSRIVFQLANAPFEFDTTRNFINEYEYGTNLDESFAIGDLDKDGDEDVVVYYENDHKLSWYENPFIHDFQVSGKVFYDLIHNGIYDLGEPGINQSYVDVQPLNTYIYTSTNGRYFINPPGMGNLQVSSSLVNDPDWTLTSDSVSYNITLTDSIRTKSDVNFGFRPVDAVYGVEPNIVSAPTRCSFDINQWITIANTGSLYASGVVSYTLDTNCTFISSNVPTDSISSDSLNLFWHYEDVLFNQTESFEILVNMPGVDQIGDTLMFVAEASGYDSLNMMAFSNIDTFYSVLNCAYDPNDKLCEPLPIDTTDGIPFDTEELEYTVRFQNTGTDTAFNIVIKDVIDDNLNLATLKVLSSSHGMNTVIDVNTRTVDFVFNNILLPDSNINEPESHGYVNFEIKIASHADVDSTIQNNADIYFDFNPPIITNNVSRTLVSPSCYQTSELADTITLDENYELPSGTLVSEPGVYIDTLDLNHSCDSIYTVSLYVDSNVSGTADLISECKISVFPNPANEMFHLMIEEFSYPIEMEIFNGFGELVYRQKIAEPRVTVLSRTWNSGIYLIKLNDAQKRKHGFRKIIVSR